MNKIKEHEVRKKRVIDALLDPNKKSLTTRYEIEFIVQCLLDWERDKNYSRVAKKYNVNVKTITSWAERLKDYYAKQYQKNAEQITNLDRPVEGDDIVAQNYALDKARRENIKKLGGNIESIEQNFYDLSASALYDMMNDIMSNTDSLTASQKISFISTMLKMKGESLQSAKELNKRLYNFFVNKLSEYIVRMIEQDKLQCVNGLTPEGLFMELENIKRVTLMETDD